MIGFISDIHGNFPALRQVVQELRAHGCKDIYCLGDTAGYYSMINECINFLRAEQIVSLKGNHDSYLLSEGQCPRSKSANDCIRYQQRVITPENLQWLSELPSILTTTQFQAVHGGWNNPFDEYIDNFDFENPIIQQLSCNIFLSGHTHIQTLQKKSNIVYCNPGSVGQPRDHDWRAAYAILEQTDIILCRTQYNIKETALAMQRAGFDSYYYRNLYHGCKIGEI